MFVADPSGYVPTTPVGYGTFTLPGGSSYVIADFGYQASAPLTTYTLSDRVWFDADGDGLLGGGEVGIGGVTVSILDSSLFVIGTTTTASDGTFSFSGLAGSGADYTVRLTDTSGALTDFVGTTTYGQTRERLEPNLTASIDRRLPAPWPTGPSYGFRATRAIGDTAFVDTDGDGTQDVGEVGLPGVTVQLFRDTNGNGSYDAGVDLQFGGNAVTDANGQYLFPGLPNGTYFVRATIPSGYNATNSMSRTIVMAGVNDLSC